MKKRKQLTTSLQFLLITVLFFIPLRMKGQNYVPLENDAKVMVKPRIPIRAYSFPLKETRLLDGPFKTAMGADKEWLMSLQPNRFLHRFHANAGLPAKGAIYGGWENTTQSGFSFGHYISALSMLYAATGDTDVKERVEYCISELKRCQDARGTGYVGAIPGEDKLWNDVANGNIEAKNFNLNGIWVPWYNLHKLWSGLIDAYFFAESDMAKDVVIRLTDWACHKFNNLTEEQWQQILTCESGGMNDALYNVYAISGNPAHLQLAGKFYHKAVLDPLSQEKDDLAGKHANTQIPKVIGASRSYELTGDEKGRTIARFFWDIVTHDHSYCIGGNSNYEHFGEPGQLSGELSNKTTETCNTYNMLKLTRHLFSWEPSASYMDYYERALYNHILASQDPSTGMVCYNVPLAGNSEKNYSTPENSFWCCVGTGFESHVKYAEQIYSHSDKDLFVNLFIASTVYWKEKDLRITQQTTFPERDSSILMVSTSKPQTMTFHIRYPGWVKSGYAVKVNDQLQNLNSSPGAYVSVTREWKEGDKIEISLPKTPNKELLPGDDYKTAFLNGPIVLAGETDITQTPPVFINDGVHQERGIPKDITFVPFYKKHSGYYTVYFDVFTPAEWEEKKEEYEKEKEEERELERLTVDYFRPNEQQEEVDHQFSGDNVTRGMGVAGRKWCAAKGGYFSFEMKVDPNVPVDLVLTYWGNDGKNRNFDIMIGNEVIAQESLTGRKKPNEYFNVRYPIPFHLTKGKDKVIVKLQADMKNMAGGIYGVKILRNKKLASAVVYDYLLPKEPHLKEHHLTYTENLRSGTHMGHSWIDANKQGSLSFEMKCSQDVPTALQLSYWGGEGNKRNFAILIDREKIAEQELYMNKPDELFEVTYPIPKELTKEKEKITVTLDAIGNVAGGLYYAYTFSDNPVSGINRVAEERFELFSIHCDDSRITIRNVSEKTFAGTVSFFSSSGFRFYEEKVRFRDKIVLKEKIPKGFYVVHIVSEEKDVYQCSKIVV